MSKNVNESKTEAIGFGPLAVSGRLNQVLGSLAASVKQCVKNASLLFDKEVNAVVKVFFFSS